MSLSTARVALVRLEGIQTGDIVQVDRLGRRFLAFVLGPAPNELSLQPVDRRVSYRSCRAREVIGHWSKRGRPKASDQPLGPSPRQLELELDRRR